MDSPPCLDACRCPLCGQPNHCAMERTQPVGHQQPCWCTREQFSAQLLQQVPEPLKNKACICRACVQAAHAAA